MTPSAAHNSHPAIEVDELWTGPPGGYVGNKLNVVWIWIALESKSRRIIGRVFGDRSEHTAKRLCNSLPPYYQQNGVFFTDSWPAYNVLPDDQHFAIDKATNHIERFNSTLRPGGEPQRCSSLVRKTLSFSKSLSMHQHRIYKFINHHNSSLAL